MHMDVLGVCICHAVGVEAREAPHTSSLNLFEAGSRMFAAVCTRLAGHELSERLCAFHFRSFHSSTGFIHGAASPGFPWVLGMQKSPPSCLCSKRFPHYAVFQARQHLSLNRPSLFLAFFLRSFSPPLSFTPFFIMSTGPEPQTCYLCNTTHITISKHPLLLILRDLFLSPGETMLLPQFDSSGAPSFSSPLLQKSLSDAAFKTGVGSSSLLS